MLIPKKHRITILKYLFNEGVICAKKDFNAPQHNNLEVPNLYVIKLMTSLKSRHYVKESFNWQWFYWYLTNEGIQYLREYLHLSEDVVPNTLKRPKPAPRASTGGDRDRYARGGDRDRDREGGYRSRRFDGEKKAGAPPAGEFQPSFRGERSGGRGGGRGRDREGGYRRDYGERREGGFGRGGGRGGDRGGDRGDRAPAAPRT